VRGKRTQKESSKESTTCGKERELDRSWTEKRGRLRRGLNWNGVVTNIVVGEEDAQFRVKKGSKSHSEKAGGRKGYVHVDPAPAGESGENTRRHTRPRGKIRL